MTEKVLSVETFKRRVDEDVRNICNERGLKYDTEAHRGQAFQIWFSRLLAQREGVELDGSEGVFGSKDLKIDIAIEDGDEKVLYLIQTKFVSLASLPSLNETEVNDFFSRHEILLKHDWVLEHASDELLEFVGDYEARLKDNWSIYFYFVSTGRASDRIKELVDDSEVRIKQEQPGVSFVLLDFYGLKEFFVEAQTLTQKIPEHVEFDLPRDRYIYRSSPRPTIVASIKANALVNLYRKERESLFAHNIRSFLGRKGINKQIATTAKEHPENFFYFNNGVSAICTSFDVNKETGKFVGENFQIINGAQTIGALKGVKDLPGSVEVLLRITEGESVKTEKGFNADVIRYNNTQNVIKSSDFRSNDAIQLWLENHFNSLRARGALTRPIKYQRKRSFQRAHGADGLKFEDLAKIRYCWLFEPTRCVADPRSLWAFEQDGGVYEKAFGVDGDLTEFYDEEIFDETVLAIVSYWAVEQKISDLIKRDRTKFTFLRRLRYFALKLFAEYLDIKGIKYNEIFNSRSVFDTTFDEFWRDAFKELVSEHHDATQRDKITVFALARNESRWLSVKEKFVTYLAGI